MAQDIKFPRINSVMLSGHLTRDVELRYTPKGMPVARMSLAFNRAYKNADGEWTDEANYIDAKSFGKQAETCSERLHKGSPVIIEGYISTYVYTTKDNQQRKNTEVIVNKIQYLEKYYSSDDNDSNMNNNDDNFSIDDESKITADDVPF